MTWEWNLLGWRIVLVSGVADAAKFTYFGLHRSSNAGVKRGQEFWLMTKGNWSATVIWGFYQESFKKISELDKLTQELEPLDMCAMRLLEKLLWWQYSANPFFFRFHDMQFGLLTMGISTNAASLKKELEQRAIFGRSSILEIFVILFGSHNLTWWVKSRKRSVLLKVVLLICFWR